MRLQAWESWNLGTVPIDTEKDETKSGDSVFQFCARMFRLFRVWPLTTVSTERSIHFSNVILWNNAERWEADGVQSWPPLDQTNYRVRRFPLDQAFFSSKASRQAWKANRHPNQWIPGALPQGYRVHDVQPCLQPRIKLHSLVLIFLDGWTEHLAVSHVRRPTNSQGRSGFSVINTFQFYPMFRHTIP
jgi:hypothetical protein